MAIQHQTTATKAALNTLTLSFARVLAPRYPAQAIMSYIPAVSWVNTLKLSDVTEVARC